MKKFIENNMLIILVIISILLTIFSWVYSSFIFKVTYREELGILARNGYLAIWQPSITAYWVQNIIHIFVMIGLLFSPRYFRTLLLLMLAFNYCSSLFLGYYVSPPIADFLTTIHIFISGLIVMLLFNPKGKRVEGIKRVFD